MDTCVNDLECVVCFNQYSRKDRIPRVLHCNHTFCTPCLQRVSKLEGRLYMVSCPLCRWITCTVASLTLPGSLGVNTDIWDQIVEEMGETDAESSGETLSNPALSPPTLSRPALSPSKRSGFTGSFLRLLALACVPVSS